jgi:hypothetical protein
VNNAEVRQQLEAGMENLAGDGRNLAAAIRQILEGERDEDVLCEPLNENESPIIGAILRGIADPETLKPLLAGEEE